MNSIQDLLNKPLWQMTGREFCSLAESVLLHTPSPAPVRSTIIGVRALAEFLGCCESTVYSLRRHRVLDDAIVSHIGRRIVFDGDRARDLANTYKECLHPKIHY